MPKDDELEQAHEIGKLKSEVHTLNTLVSKLFEKFDSYIEKNQPKQMGVNGYIGIALSILSILALVFGSMMYMTNSANAPMVAQITQFTKVISTIQNNVIQNTNNNQLLTKELSGLAKSVDSNEETLRWIIFRENLPKQITETQGRMDMLEMQIREIKNKGR